MVGAGPAGLSVATVAAERGHQITLYEADQEIGGQFNIAKDIPGKEDFTETLRYYSRMLDKHNVEVKTNERVTVEALRQQKYDHIVVATGVKPRPVNIPGHNHPMVLGYDQVVRGRQPVGRRVAIIGAGGIGFDLAEFLLHDASHHDTLAEWYGEWGIDPQYDSAGSLVAPTVQPPAREIFLLQRKSTAVGKGLGKTSGWVHRLQMKKKDVQMLSGVRYLKIDDFGLHIEINGQSRLLSVDNIVICAGQLSLNDLYQALNPYGKEKQVHLIGGALLAAEVDAKRAIREGATLGARL